jgi:GNAT superfamily N-acetyltransferase
MDKTQLITFYDQDQRKDVQYPFTQREVFPHLVRHINTAWDEGFVIYSLLNESNVEETIREQITYFEKLGKDFEWKLYEHDQPSNLKERLQAHGFKIEEPEATLVLDLQEAPKILLKPITHTIRQITDPEHIEMVQQIEEEVWQEDYTQLANILTRTLIEYPENIRIYVAYIEEKPVSVAWMYLPQGSRFASLWGGSTLETYRGRGLYTALLAVRLQEAMRRQREFLTVDAGPLSRPILEKFGFQMIGFSYPCKWQAKDKNSHLPAS